MKKLSPGKLKLQTHHLTTNEVTAQVSLTLKPWPKAITWFVPGQISAGHREDPGHIYYHLYMYTVIITWDPKVISVPPVTNPHLAWALGTGSRTHLNRLN